jgi:hypothetical protein
MTSLDWGATLARCKIIKGKVHPVNSAALRRYEKEQKMRLPKSYYGFCQTFGPGCIITTHEYYICSPNTKPGRFNIDELNQGAHRSISATGSDAYQIQRGIFLLLIWLHLVIFGMSPT